PGGQQPSPDTHAVCTSSFTHWAWQVPGLTRWRCWQPMAGHAVGQLERGSQVSPQAASIMPLPHVQLQSLSFAAVQLARRQPSPATQAVCMPSSTQRAVQAAADPSSFLRVQPSDGQLFGQLDGGSQVSPSSSLPLPQLPVAGSASAGGSPTPPSRLAAAAI